jgi:hypothetical protein
MSAAALAIAIRPVPVGSNAGVASCMYCGTIVIPEA